jgi:hypothetical protein
VKSQGVKVLDRMLETAQVDWLVVSTRDCPDQTAEQRIIRTHFRVPHDAWTSPRAFVQPVTIRRGRNRVLFLQASGIGL